MLTGIEAPKAIPIPNAYISRTTDDELPLS